MEERICGKNSVSGAKYESVSYNRQRSLRRLIWAMEA
jgi:hypothetical protein